MLTRLKVSGFKNLVDVDVRYRIPALLELLQDIATDINEPIGLDNPLRQVIINTHSPAVVSEVLDDSLLVAELKETG